jgi:hypothetical protein
MLRKRDKEIIANLERFRCMSRDDIVDIHFAHLKNPINSANTVLKRMYRDKLIERSTNFQPFVYFPADSKMKKGSAKIPHFLAIVDVYKQLRYYKEPRTFIVEPKYGKGYMEPDIFTIWRGTPMFIEVQRSVYSESVMSEKIKRYEAYYDSDEWKTEPWQPENKAVFPGILILTDTRYAIKSDRLKVLQAPSIDDFVSSIRKNAPPSRVKSENGAIKLKLG